MRRLLLLPVLLFALAAAVACTGSSPPSKAKGSAPADANPLVQFAKCMREHGQNMPDPDPNSDSYQVTPPAGSTSAAWQAALQACQHFLPDGGAPQAPTATELEALRQYAACMRAHGIESSDPDPNTGKSTVQGRLANATRDQLQADPGYRAAQEACKDKLPKGSGG